MWNGCDVVAPYMLDVHHVGPISEGQRRTTLEGSNCSIAYARALARLTDCARWRPRGATFSLHQAQSGSIVRQLPPARLNPVSRRKV